MKSMVKLHYSPNNGTDYYHLIVINKQFGHQYFVVIPEKLSEALGNPKTAVFERDVNNFVEYWYDDTRNDLCITITWLQSVCKWQIFDREDRYDKRRLDKLDGSNPDCRRGYEQIVHLDADKVFRFTETQEDVKFFYDEDAVTYPRIILTESAHVRVRKILDKYGKAGRRYLARFFKYNFKYQRSKEITLYDDPWINGFGFSEDSGTRGGVSPSTYKVKGRDGNYYQKVEYSVNT